MTDRSITGFLQGTTMLGAALLATGWALAPSHAEEPAAQGEPAVEPMLDPDLPRFDPASDPPAPELAMEPLEPAFDAVIEDPEENWEQLGSGTASWYGLKFKGRRTASGEIFNPSELTAAHRTLPFGTRVRVTRGGKSVVVRINDRGPFVRGRVIDVSQAAAREIDLIGPGHGTVTLALLAE